MKLKKCCLAAAMAFALFTASNAGATGVLGDDFQLEIQTDPTPAPTPDASAPVELYLDGSQPRPGEAPRISSLTVQVQAELAFETPMSPARADLKNEADSGLVVVYLLRVPVSELLEKIGRSGYPEEEYQQMLQDPAFDPETSYVTLSQSKGIPPGMAVSEISLGTLPDGSTLPAGRYHGELLMIPFGEETLEQAMVNATVGIDFTVENDVFRLIFDQDLLAPISVFNPLTSDGPIRFGILISQGQVRKKTGAPHNSAEELERQEEEGMSTLMEDYVFMPLFVSEEVAPGEFLEEIALSPLPDGERLPSGSYTAWLVRYEKDPDTGEEVMLDATTQAILEIP